MIFLPFFFYALLSFGGTIIPRKNQNGCSAHKLSYFGHKLLIFPYKILNLDGNLFCYFTKLLGKGTSTFSSNHWSRDWMDTLPPYFSTV